MAEPLKNQFAEDIPEKIASMLLSAGATFNSTQFIDDCLQGYADLELTQRARQLSSQLRQYLPEDFNQSSQLILRSLGPKLASSEEFGMTPFLYLPYVYFVSENGLEHFDAAMELQYELTQRFTAEFSIRHYLIQHREETLHRLKQWASDPSEHVRRLVSEGTRPLLPWANRLDCFRQDPEPVLELLEMLKDDPSLYVRRSVANNLNDISKDHPDRVNEVCETWLINASAERKWLVKHALRTLIKKGNSDTLSLLGFGAIKGIHIDDKNISPKRVAIGEEVTIAFSLSNKTEKSVDLMVDYSVDFIKANGNASQKVFKLKQVKIAPGETISLEKPLSLKQRTTRKHYPGKHNVSIMLNGNLFNLGAFDLTK